VNPVDYLPVIAEISLGLVGFTAIVTALRRPDGGPVGWDLLGSLYLLAYASATLLLALLPSLLSAMGGELAVTWQISSVAMLLCSLVGFAFNPWRRARLHTVPPGGRTRARLFASHCCWLRADRNGSSRVQEIRSRGPGRTVRCGTPLETRHKSELIRPAAMSRSGNA
jgi:hypothetical protein